MVDNIESEQPNKLFFKSALKVTANNQMKWMEVIAVDINLAVKMSTIRLTWNDLTDANSIELERYRWMMNEGESELINQASNQLNNQYEPEIIK